MANRKVANATRAILAAAGATTIALAGSPSFAQELEEVVVTGSRIVNPNLSSASQVLAVSSEEISLLQVTTAEALLRELPGVVPSIGPGVNNGNNGAQTINLRGLGSNRNVVLLDSRRLVPWGLAGITDTSNIPLGLIERVDVVTGGASSVYGADAIAGVTNFITKRNFEGVQIDTGYRETEEGDGQSFRADLLIGGNFADGRGNAVVGLGYRDSKPVLQGDRKIGLAARSSVTGGPGGSSAAAPVVVAGGTLGTLQLSQDGNSLVPFYAPYNFNPLNIYQTPIEKYNIYGQANFKVSDSVEAYGQAWYTTSVVETQIAESATFFNTYRLPISNPFMPVAVRNRICQGYGISQADCDAAAATTNANDPRYREVSIGLRRRFIEWGPRTSTFENDAFQIVGGLRGQLPADWSWDLSAQYGESGQVSTIGKYGLFSRVQQALRATSTSSCSNAAGGCVPINLFGTVGSMTQAMFNYIDASASSRTDTSLGAINLNFSGDLGELKLPTSEERISTAVGFEYREYIASARGDFLSAQPGELLGAGGANPPVKGKYDVAEFYTEFLVPLVTDAAFAKSIALEAGFRYSDYSTTGNSSTWKLGGSWEVTDNFRLRTVFQSAVRSPNISELFFPVQTGLANRSTDPCQGAAPTTNAALRAICISQGAPAGSIGFITAPAAGQINTTRGGNPNLDTEEAETLTVGFLWSPIDNLTLSVDYFKIELDGAISSPAIDDVVNGCFGSSFNPNLTFNAACSNIRRNRVDGSLNGSPADVQGVVVASSNQGKIETSGLDFGAGYGWDLGEMGRLTWNLNATYTFDNKFQATPVSVNRDCLGYYSINCGNLQPELTANQRFTWSFNAFDLSLRHRYLSSTSVEPALKGVYLRDFENISSYNYVDLTARWKATDKINLTLTVDNVTSESPPDVGSDIGPTSWNSGNTYPTVYDTLGRTYSLGVTVKF